MNTDWLVGAAGVVLLVVVFGVPIANAIRNKLYERQMRRFSDTRGRRRSEGSR